jgi:L-Ala-D/L-Glu epimerase
MPTVTDLRLFAVDLPFRKPFRHAAAERNTSESIFLRIQLDGGVAGWGECLPRSYVSGESREEAFALLRDLILPALLGRTFSSLVGATSFLEKCDGKAPAEWVPPEVPQSSAWCAVDLALIDAFGQASGDAAWLDATYGAGKGDVRAPAPTAAPQYRYSGVVSAGRGWRDMVSLLKIRAFGFRHVKLKLEQEGAVEAARTARRLLGRRVDLRIDANMAWDTEQALGLITELRTIGIASFEQPIAADDLDGLARLVRETSAGIVADEGVTDSDSLQRLIKQHACTGVNVRISKCGGLVGARARCHEVLDAGLMLQLGCQVGESSLLSAAHVTLMSALAHRTPGVRYAEGCFGRHLLREDPVSPSLQFRYGGRPPRRPTGAGLGIRMDQAKLQQWTVGQAHVS